MKPKSNRPKSAVPDRKLLGYMAFNRATGAMALLAGYSPWFGKIYMGADAVPIVAIYSQPVSPEATVFSSAKAAKWWIGRTIRIGRQEWKRKCAEDGVQVDWRDSDWKWLRRQSWSVVPVFEATGLEHRE